MKSILLSLFAVILVSGCSTMPTTPEPHPEKYTVQVVEVTLTEDHPLFGGREDNHQFNSEEQMLLKESLIQAFAESPSAAAVRIVEYPVVYAAVGETAINNQTESILFPENFHLVDGKVVPTKETPVFLGKSIKATVVSVEDDIISYKLMVYFRALNGYETYPLGEGQEAEMPMFTLKGMDTLKFSQKLNTWLSLGEVNTTPNNSFFYVRVIPPSPEK